MSIFQKPNLVLSYDGTLDGKITSEDLSVPEKVRFARQAAEYHRQTREYIRSRIKPNMKILDICTDIENKIRELTKDEKIPAGIGFPCGFSIDHVAAHDSAIPDDKRIIKPTDIFKIDYGTHVNGYIIDSAFTMTFNPVLEPLQEAAKESMWAGIKTLGPDVLIDEVSKNIQEVIESYELTINNKVQKIYSSRSLGGHSLDQYTIHAGDLILGVPNLTDDKNARIKADTFYAVETFPNTSPNGVMYIDPMMPCSHYALSENLASSPSFKLKKTKEIYNYLKKTRGKLPWCTRWLFDQFGSVYNVGLNELVSKKLVKDYQPIVGPPFTRSAQFEHTIYIGDYGKEVLSYGPDY